MVKKILIITAVLVTAIIGTGFCQDSAPDGVLGDYIISSLKKTVSLDLQNAKMMDVLKMLSQQSGLNFVASDAVQDREVTLYFENASMQEAINILFKANNLVYDYYPDANIFVVKELGRPMIETQTKIYPLKYARLTSSRMKQEIDSKLGSSSGGGSSGSSSSSSSSSGSGGGENDIKSAVQKVLSASGKITEDTASNSLIVTDVPMQFPVIDRVVASLDQPVPRVMIEVEMLDVSKSLIDNAGIQYGSDGSLQIGFNPASMATAFPYPTRLLKGDNLGARLQTPTTSGSSSSSSTISPSFLNMSTFTMLLNMLTSNTSTKILARPRILTLSNELAEVDLTSDEVVGVTTSISGSTSTTSESVERMETGTKLRVSPQVNPNSDDITLYVEVSNKDTKDSGIKVTGMSGDVRNPEDRETRSVLRLKSGETLLIGGLIKNTDTTTETKIPFLGDIPLLGKAFQYHGKNKEEREILVFLTPHLLDEKPVLAKNEPFFNREQENPLKMTKISAALDRFSR